MSWVRRTAIAAACILAAEGCSRQDGTIGPKGAAIPVNPRPDRPYVVEFPEPWISGCDDGCENAYLEFLAHHGKKDSRMSDQELSTWLAETLDQPKPVRLELSDAALAQQILRGLAIEQLLDGLKDRPLVVAVLRETSGPQGIERKLLFWDREIGSFEGLLLLPAGSGPHPAVIGLHGHRDDDEVFADEYLGRELSRSGFAVLMPRFRAMNCGRRENNIALELLKNSLTLMGLRVYETLLMAKYLEHLEGIDAGRLGLLGHSGGGAVANLTVRISDAFDAKVTDHKMNWWEGCGPKNVHCETIPGLMPLSATIDDESQLGIPFLGVRYKFRDPAETETILTFFEKALAIGE